MTRHDIAVAGCGIAGLAAALLLHRDGHRVTVFERFAAPRPIGSGLIVQPTGLAVLDRLGAADAVIARGARIDRLFGEAGGSGRTVLDVRYASLGRDRFGIGIHRAGLFDVLHDRVVGAGIAVEAGRTVASADDGRLTFDDGSTAGPFDLVVDALGARSALTREAGRPLAYGALWASLPWADGFDAHALQQRYRAASVMVGVLPTGMDQAAIFWSLRADRLDTWCAAGLGAWKAEVTALWPATAPLLAHIADADQLTFAHYAHRTLAEPGGRRLIHIGDAWHATSPQLGQGANMALLDAWALALALREAPDVGAAIARTIALRRRHVRFYQAMSALFTPVYQSDSRVLPAIRDWLVGPLSKLWPATRIQAAMVSGLAGDPLTPLRLA
jgi:2-polyprenyl-6-methoxyphenol hydroxylase-like FAD-dependent oxidoreductase